MKYVFVPLGKDSGEPEATNSRDNFRKRTSAALQGVYTLLIAISWLVFIFACVYTVWYFADKGLEAPSTDAGSEPHGACSVANARRLDCHPAVNATEESCLEKGCCWRLAGTPSVDEEVGVPACFFPANYETYLFVQSTNTTYGMSARAKFVGRVTMPSVVSNLQLEAYYETGQRLRVKIFDQDRTRYEVPYAITPRPNVTSKHPTPDYLLEVTRRPFGFRVTRRSDRVRVFDSTVGPIMFYDQFLQISLLLAGDNLYGLGETRSRFLKRLDTRVRFALWARDQPPYPDNNLYGDHPFAVNILKDGSAVGVLLMNSNAMEFDLSPGLTFRPIGGVLDLYMFMGPSPLDVVDQYWQLVGRPTMPPYWALGFHLCRFGYTGTGEIRNLVDNMKAAGIPQDVQWTDIDYMDHFLDFTYDKDKFGNITDLVHYLHAQNQFYVPILDPAISDQQRAGGYPPYDEGLAMGVFIKDPRTMAPMQGKVWPGLTAFPDFTARNTSIWWTKQLTKFHGEIPFDGVWIDMSEPSSFVEGSTSGCVGGTFDDPPYVPDIDDRNLKSKTLCPSALQALSTHYNLHNMFGVSEMLVTNKALLAISPKLRPFILSRSTFVGAGRYGYHWLGDNTARWVDLKASVPGLLNFQLFGVPLVGADICGFNGDTTEQLCRRWYQLAAFYPFSRSHNTLGARPQDPLAFGPDFAAGVRYILRERYRLLPFFYTCFHAASTIGKMPVSPLSFEFAGQSATWSIDEQFLWGGRLLVSPVLYENATSVSAFFPDGVWYDYYNGTVVPGGQTVTLDAPFDRINLHLRGGSVIPTQEPGLTTAASRLNRYSLWIALDSSGSSDGLLYVDDGKSVAVGHNYTHLSFSVAGGRFVSTVVHAGMNLPPLDSVKVLGVVSRPAFVRVGGSNFPFTWNDNTLYVTGLDRSMTQSFSIIWR